MPVNKINEYEEEFLPEKQRKYTYKRWSDPENERFVDFLTANQHKFSNNLDRKPRNFFKKMAEAMGGTKSNEQCRNHFIKILKHFKTIKGIIEGLTKQGDDSRSISLAHTVAQFSSSEKNSSSLDQCQVFSSSVQGRDHDEKELFSFEQEYSLPPFMLEDNRVNDLFAK